MYSTLHSNFLARPLRSLAFVSRCPIIQSSLYTSPFQLKTRHRNVFTAATRALSTSCVRWSDRKTDDTKGSAVTPPLRENIYTIPNLLTVSRILSCPISADGYLARRFSMHSVLGTILDPAADKTLMTTLTVTLAMKGLLPVLSAFYIRYTSLPAPVRVRRIFQYAFTDLSRKPLLDIGTFLYHLLNFHSQYNTFAQLALMCATTVTPILPTQYDLFVPEMQILVAVTTVWSGLSYVFSKDAVRIVSETRKSPPPS
ncbi:hypothetical protein BD769DRAFT_1436194 [Suillus cothurnatus]|nr:hypothetical protein BD769DRAFT_1436194 [Suillus cothurnatus]